MLGDGSQEGERCASAIERRSLRFVSEQQVVRVDQLARFLGVSYAEAEELVERLEKKRWVKKR